MYTIENDQLRIIIDARGAELNSLYNKENDCEYIWNADPVYWGKKSPVLFPIVGTLKDNTYFFEEKGYQLSRHGFARDKNFTVSDQAETTITFLLQQDESTLSVYPFYFNFSLRYSISGNKLSVTYLVENTGSAPMYFSVGGHPAFRLPIAEGLSYEDYHLLFNKTENIDRWPISPEGLIEKTSIPLLSGTNRLPLSKQLFDTDAIVLKNLQSDAVLLVSDTDSRSIDFNFAGFPYLGLWAAKNADFICIEPWCGVADGVGDTQDITKKEGINALGPGEKFERCWEVKVF